MARQKYLRYTLSPFIHAIFGGKPVVPQWILWFVPRQRVMVLSLCLFLNIYYVYLTYRERFPDYPGFDAYFTMFYDKVNASYTDNGLPIQFDEFTIMSVLGWIHFSLNSSIYIRNVLNSNAAASLGSEEEVEDDHVAKKSIFTRITTAVYRFAYGFVLILLSEWWAATVCVFSICAIYFSQWFYVPCLLEIIPQFALMQFLVESIRRNVTKIGFTILLALLILYFYATIAYLLFPDQYGMGNNGGHPDCGDLLSCFKTHIDYGLQNSPDWFNPSFVKPDMNGILSPDTNPWAYLISSAIGSVFIISFAILINLVLSAVISGIIIDTFSSMRQKEEEIQEDIKSSCFICSIARDEFESNGIDYKTHIKDEHNMWKYAWLKFYLQEKDPLLFTGPEQFAFDQMKDKGTFLKLFPVKRSLSLNRMKARARSTESRVELQTLYDVLLSLEMSQKDFKKSITDVKRSQETQKDTTSNLQMKFARLQLLNTEALKESMASAKNELSRKEDSSFKYARETSAPTIVKKTVPGEDEHEF
jgi:hypothetical protein